MKKSTEHYDHINGSHYFEHHFNMVTDKNLTLEQYEEVCNLLEMIVNDKLYPGCDKITFKCPNCNNNK